MKKIVLMTITITFITLYFIDKKSLFISDKYNDIITNIQKVSEEIVLNESIDDSITNEDIVGSIKIDGTNINQELLQGEDNDYYLHHNKDKQEDINGSIFIDYRNNLDDQKILIYGHNGRFLKTVPFHDLEKFIAADFLNSNNNIELNINGNISNYKIFSVMIVSDTDNTHMQLKFTQQSWCEHLTWLKENSIYDTLIDVDANDSIIVLQTCYYNPNNSYLVISAKKI